MLFMNSVMNSLQISCRGKSFENELGYFENTALANDQVEDNTYGDAPAHLFYSM